MCCSGPYRPAGSMLFRLNKAILIQLLSLKCPIHLSVAQANKVYPRELDVRDPRVRGRVRVQLPATAATSSAELAARFPSRASPPRVPLPLPFPPLPNNTTRCKYCTRTRTRALYCFACVLAQEPLFFVRSLSPSGAHALRIRALPLLPPPVLHLEVPTNPLIQLLENLKNADLSYYKLMVLKYNEIPTLL